MRISRVQPKLTYSWRRTLHTAYTERLKDKGCCIRAKKSSSISSKRAKKLSFFKHSGLFSGKFGEHVVAKSHGKPLVSMEMEMNTGNTSQASKSNYMKITIKRKTEHFILFLFAIFHYFGLISFSVYALRSWLRRWYSASPQNTISTEPRTRRRYYNMVSEEHVTIVECFHPLEIIMWMPSVFAHCAIKSRCLCIWKNIWEINDLPAAEIHHTNKHTNKTMTVYRRWHNRSLCACVFRYLSLHFLLLCLRFTWQNIAAATSRYSLHVNT